MAKVHPATATAEPAIADPIRKPRRLVRFSRKPVALLTNQLLIATPLLGDGGPGIPSRCSLISSRSRRYAPGRSAPAPLRAGIPGSRSLRSCRGSLERADGGHRLG